MSEDQPIPVTHNSLVETFKTMPDHEKDLVFVIRSGSLLYFSPDNPVDIYDGTIIPKVDKDGKKQTGYYVMMDRKEFEELFPEGGRNVKVKPVGRLVRFNVLIEPLYFKHPHSETVKKHALDSKGDIYLWFHPKNIFHPGIENLPAFEEDPSGYYQ
ncbi:MAG: hypothetical protein ABH812_01010 [bacterium]